MARVLGRRLWSQDQVAQGFDYRNGVIAGWTGPAQVQKGVSEPAGYTGLDVAYVDACGKSSGVRIVRTDLAILWQTVVVMARGEGLRF